MKVITQLDFANGPYIIKESGKYMLGENITFNASDGQIYDWIIMIQALEVSLDFNGYTIQQDANYAYYARFMSGIYVNESVLSCKEKEGCSKGKIKIFNGTILRCSDCSIRTSPKFKGTLYVEAMNMSSYELACIYTEHHGSCKYNNLTIGANYYLWYLTINYDYARKLIQTAFEIARNPKVPTAVSIGLLTNINTLSLELDSAVSLVTVDPTASRTPWLIGSINNKLIAAIYSTTKVTMTNVNISGLNITSILTSKLTASDGTTVIDPSGSPLQPYYFLTSSVPSQAWATLLSTTSIYVQTYNLSYPSIPYLVIVTLLDNGTLPPEYAYSAAYNPTSVIYLIASAQVSDVFISNITDMNVVTTGLYAEKTKTIKINNINITSLVSMIINYVKCITIMGANCIGSITLNNCTNICMRNNNAGNVTITPLTTNVEIGS